MLQLHPKLCVKSDHIKKTLTGAERNKHYRCKIQVPFICKKRLQIEDQRSDSCMLKSGDSGHGQQSLLGVYPHLTIKSKYTINCDPPVQTIYCVEKFEKKKWESE